MTHIWGLSGLSFWEKQLVNREWQNLAFQYVQGFSFNFLFTSLVLVATCLIEPLDSSDLFTEKVSFEGISALSRSKV